MQNQSRNKPTPQSAVFKTLKTFLIVCALTAAFAVLLFALLVALLSITEYRPRDVENAIVISDMQNGETGAPHAASAVSDAGQKNPARPPLDAGQSVRIVSWNIGYGALGAKQDFFMDGGSMVRPKNKAAVEENLNGIAEFIKTHNADVWFIQEMDIASSRSFYIDESRFLSRATAFGGTYAYNYKCLFVPFPFPPLGRVASGLATFTDLSCTASERRALPVPFKWPVRLANLKRCMLVNRFPLSCGNQLVAVNVHLEAYDDGEGKVEQTKALMNFLTAEYDKGNYVIAGGDFNQLFPGLDKSAYLMREQAWHAGILDEAMLPALWRFAADGTVPSCRSNDAAYESALYDENVRKNWPYYFIDGCILSPIVTLRSVCTYDEFFMYADHNPVELEVVLEKSGI